MHTVTRPWNLPFGLALAGGIFLAGGALAWPFYRAATPAEEPPREEPSPVEEPCPTPGSAELDPKRPGAKLAADGVGGGPAAPAQTPAQEDAGAEDAESEAGEDAEGDADPDAEEADAEGDAEDEAGDANGDANDAAEDDAGDAEADGASAAAVGGGPQVGVTTVPAADAGLAVVASDATVATDGAFGPGAPSDAMANPFEGGAPSVNDPFLFPVYGAPPPETVTGAPIVAGDEGNETTPLYVGPSGGTTNPGIVDPKPAIAPSLIVPLRASVPLEGLWSSVSPFLRPGDLVVARVADASALAALAPWSQRVRVDLPLVGYALAFERPAQLLSALDAGLPTTVTMIGLASTDGIDDATLAAAATKAHAAGKKVYVSVTVPTTGEPKGPSYATVSAHADVVELVVPGSDAVAAAKMVRPVVVALQSVRRPEVYLQLSANALSSTARLMGRSTDAVRDVIPGIGIAMPWSTTIDRNLSELRATPSPP